MIKPQLYGLKNTNRDFTQKDAWGKNNFNSAFPASLCCYMESKNIKPVYIKTNRAGEVFHTTLSVSSIFGLNYADDATFFAFEAQYSPYQRFVIDELPRIDLVVQNLNNKTCVSGLEIKLTALPDEATFNQTDEEFGSELVIRPDSIVYLACSIANAFNQKFISDVLPRFDIEDWSDAWEVSSKIDTILKTLYTISTLLCEKQTPFLLQPIWKTEGKSPLLAEKCLDVFIWSNTAFINFIADISNTNTNINQNKITRASRAAIWLFKMLMDYADNGKFNHRKIIDSITFNTKNDKAFSANGKLTHKFMSCGRLTSPAISKYEIKNIILGDGQSLLSPERRFDAIISNTPGLFE